jgi:galacturan 1,4-alpha-galacturonidase
MHFKLTSILTVAAAALSVASPTFNALKAWEELVDSVEKLEGHKGQPDPNHISPRPDVSCHPKTPRKPPPHHPQRTKTCYVKSHGNGADDSDYILAAVHACNNGGHVVFSQGTQYTIGKALDLTFLKSIDIDIQGYIQFTNDTTYWQANSFKLIFQNVTTFWNFGGEDVNVYGMF